MSTDRPGGPLEGPDRGATDGERRAGRQASDDAWGAFGLMVSGVVVWGGAGYLVSRWTHHQIFTMVGLLLGMGTALYGVWFRYGRS
jgi:F0F1-type ATP synthase assembly protein I